jgi:hypothetical protein
VIHAPQLVASAPAAGAAAAGATELPLGGAPGWTFVGGLTTVVTDGDGSVWSCGLRAPAAGTSASATRSTKRTFRIALTLFRVGPPPGSDPRAAVDAAQDVPAGQE